MIGRASLNEDIGIEFHQTPFGVCLIFFRNGVRIASFAAEPNLCTSFENEFGGFERDLTLEQVIERVKAIKV